ncbi:MAG: acetylornithine deacetylase [Motiliproteus sp.]
MQQIPSLMTMMQELIGAESVSSTLPGLDQSNLGVIAKLESWLSSAGFNCEVLDVPDQPGKANLIATLGQGSGGLVLSGHTDTVPYDQGRWNTDPFKLKEQDNRLYGLGTCDMKGFFALAIEAARSFLDRPLQQPLIILATADEETSMSGARALADMGRPKARYAIIGEPTDMQPVYMHKGMMMHRVRVRGRSGHSSNPALGNNALDAMHEVMTELLAFRREMQQQYQNSAFEVAVPTLNLGCIHGGDSPNRICGQCELDFDLRPLPGMDNLELRGQVERRLQSVAERCQIELECEALFPGIPAFENPLNSELIRMAESLTGHRAKTVAFGTEGPFLQQLGMDTIVMGPGSIDQAHQPDEYLDLKQVKPTIAILEQMIARCCL